jgi:hypothetical protein
MAANRAAGAEARTISAQSVGLESKKTSGRGEVSFLDFPLYRTTQASGLEVASSFTTSFLTRNNFRFARQDLTGATAYVFSGIEDQPLCRVGF